MPSASIRARDRLDPLAPARLVARLLERRGRGRDPAGCAARSRRVPPNDAGRLVRRPRCRCPPPRSSPVLAPLLAGKSGGEPSRCERICIESVSATALRERQQMTDASLVRARAGHRRRRPRPLDRLAPRAARASSVLVVDKTGVAAGASGIACGVVRNNYFQPAMGELMAACVEIWESDPEALHYHGSGYIALGPAAQEPDLVEVHERHQRIGYDSELITGEARRRRAHARALPRLARAGAHRLPARAPRRLRVQPGVDARAGRQGARGGRARSPRASRSRASSATAAGAVTARADERRRRRRRAGRDRRRPVDRRAVGAARPARRGSTSTSPTAASRRDQPMWTYWYLQEGEVDVRPARRS